MRERTSLRKPAVLSESTQRRLGMYALAASAAGVGTLGLTPSAEAKIVYTPAHVKILYPGVPLDFNHDQIVDFYVWIGASLPSSTLLSVCQYVVRNGNGFYDCSSSRGTNRVRRTLSGGQAWAAALKHGASIDRKGQFLKSRAHMAFVSDFDHTHTSRWFGPWANGGKGVKDRYLGLKFKIRRHFHFGWARLNVQADTGGYLHATLTGYAYETIPGKESSQVKPKARA